MSLPVRATDPQTSRDAAAQAVTRRAPVKGAILSVLAHPAYRTLTMDDLYALLSRLRAESPDLWPRVSPSGVRTRLSELVREGLVEAVPDALGRSAAGNGAHLWRLTR